MDTQTREAIQNIHDSPTLAALVVAGAGSSAVDWLLSVAGASRTVLEASVPYSERSFSEYIGFQPTQTVNSETAHFLARGAYRRALRLRVDARPVVGIACTATIATDRPKRGAHRGHVGVWASDGWSTSSLTLDKGRRDRAGEERALSTLILKTLASACGTPDSLDLGLSSADRLEQTRAHHDTPWDAFRDGHIESATFARDGTSVGDAHHKGGVLPGSFNPLHEGHRGLATVGAEILGATVTFELSVTNVDKPPLTDMEVRQRIDQFRGVGDVAISKAPVFYEKARLFPGCTFIIGWDTMARLVDPGYYEGDPARMVLSLDQIRSCGCSFLVAGRVSESGFRTLDDVDIPDMFGDMFEEIPESRFRADVASTDIRQTSRTG